MIRFFIIDFHELMFIFKYYFHPFVQFNRKHKATSTWIPDNLLQREQFLDFQNRFHGLKFSWYLKPQKHM